LFDLQSKQRQYEGACFLVTVWELEQGGLEALIGTKKKTKRRKVDNNVFVKRNKSNRVHEARTELDPHEEDTNHVMEEAEHILTSQDIIHELRIDEDSFQSVLEDISKVAKEMGDQKYHMTDKQRLAMKRIQNRGGRQEDDNDDEDEGGNHRNSKKARIEGVKEDENATSEWKKEEEELESLPRNGKPNYMAESKFMEWKNTLLQSMVPEQTTSSTTKEGSSNVLTNYQFQEMKKHAKEVLQRYNHNSNA